MRTCHPDAEHSILYPQQGQTANNPFNLESEN
jgi:hypothetical protein